MMTNGQDKGNQFLGQKLNPGWRANLAHIIPKKSHKTQDQQGAPTKKDDDPWEASCWQNCQDSNGHTNKARNNDRRESKAVQPRATSGKAEQSCHK